MTKSEFVDKVASASGLSKKDAGQRGQRGHQHHRVVAEEW